MFCGLFCSRNSPILLVILPFNHLIKVLQCCAFSTGVPCRLACPGSGILPVYDQSLLISGTVFPTSLQQVHLLFFVRNCRMASADLFGCLVARATQRSATIVECSLALACLGLGQLARATRKQRHSLDVAHYSQSQLCRCSPRCYEAFQKPRWFGVYCELQVRFRVRQGQSTNQGAYSADGCWYRPWL